MLVFHNFTAVFESLSIKSQKNIVDMFDKDQSVY